MQNSCKATGTCNAKMKKPPDNSVGMDNKRLACTTDKRKDLLPTSTNKSTMQSYGIGTLKNPGNGDVNSPQEAKAIGNQKSGQSNNFSPSRSKS